MRGQDHARAIQHDITFILHPSRRANDDLTAFYDSITVTSQQAHTIISRIDQRVTDAKVRLLEYEELVLTLQLACQEIGGDYANFFDYR